VGERGINATSKGNIGMGRKKRNVISDKTGEWKKGGRRGMEEESFFIYGKGGKWAKDIGKRMFEA